MADGNDALGYLIAYAIFSFIVSFFTVLAIFKGCQWHGRLRLLSVIPCAVGAAFPTMMFNLIRTSRTPRLLPIAVRASFGLASIAVSYSVPRR
jgi:hypothetical protein